MKKEELVTIRKVGEYMEEKQPIETNEGELNIQQWIQDNLRVIISIVIVLVIAGGIYSYSKRTETPAVKEDQKQVTEESTDKGIVSSNKEDAATQTAVTKKVATSQETETSFIESAAKGEGSTHLARRALANYLEKNPDTSLTPEHKIYIEDYLRKKVDKSSGIKVGTSLEFSKDIVQEAITKSKTLNDKQLQNLHKYSVRVPSLN
jgi:hypothetical protein